MTGSMHLLIFAAFCALISCSEDKKLAATAKSSAENQSISPPKGIVDEVKSSFTSKFGSNDRLIKDRSAPILSVNAKKSDSDDAASKKKDDKKHTKKPSVDSSTSDVNIGGSKSIQTDDLKKAKPSAPLRDRERTPSPPRVGMSARKKKGMSWQPPSRRKQMGKSAPNNRRPIEKELDLAQIRSEKVPRLHNLKERVEEVNGPPLIPGYKKSNPTNPEIKVKGTKSDPASQEQGHKLSASKSANSGPSSDEEKRRLASSGKKQSSKSMAHSISSGKIKESGKAARPKKDKDPLSPELTGLSLTLNFGPKQDSLSSDDSDDSGASESDDRKALLRKNKKRKAKEPEAEMIYNDMVSADGMKSQKTIKITGLSGPGGTKQVVGGGLGSPFNEGLVTAIPSAVYMPPAQRRLRKGPSAYAGTANNQMKQVGDMLNIMADPSGGVPNNDGPSPPQRAPRSRRPKRPRQQVADAEEEFVPPPGFVYVPVGNQVIAIPTIYNPDEEEAPLNPDEDELESHFLVQALTRTGKGRVIAVNLIRLWRILACIVINIGIFFLLNFLGINNIHVNGNNVTTT